MFHRKILLLLCQKLILPRSTSTSSGGRIGSSLFYTNWGSMSYFVTVDFFVMLPRTGRTGPAVSTRWFRYQWRLHTSHVEVFLAAVA